MNAVISVLVHLLIRLPIMRYSICLACGIVFIVLAPTLALSALRKMKAAGTNVHPSEPALALVRGGPFRFTRNPMYLALCLLQVALGFFLNDLITLLFVVPLAVIFHYGVILREEAANDDCGNGGEFPARIGENLRCQNIAAGGDGGKEIGEVGRRN